MSDNVSSVLILGVGNYLRSDEGVGIHVINALSEPDRNIKADIVDGGTAVFNALSFWKRIDKLIIVDAFKAGHEPGTITRLSLTEVIDRTEPVISLHQHGLLDALALLKQAGLSLGEVVIFGIEPALMDWGVELSEPVRDKFEALLKRITEELDKTSSEETER